MGIPIACEACHRQYKVDDKLAGKKVKCKGCGATIRVPGAEAPAGEELRECLSCGASMPAGNRVCPKCGFNVQTGQKESLLLESAAEELKARKKRRWVRKPGSPLLESLDELIKLVLLLVLIGGIVMTVVHIFRTAAEGFTFAAILPTLVVLAALAGIIAPLAALTVNITVRTMKLAPREDTYVRVALCMLLPYSVAMIAGWKEMAENWGWVGDLGWPVGILLLIYMLRAEALEWIASVVAAAAAMALSLIVVGMLGGAVNDMAGGLYADMLPSGLWTALAKGHSPEPPVTTKKAPDTAPAAIVATTSAPAASAGGTVLVTTQEGPPATATQVAINTVPGGAGGTATATAPQAAPLKLTSPFFAGIIDDPALRDAVAVVAPIAPADWMLTVKNSETTAEVDRWSLNPLEKKEHLSYPYFAKKSPQFAISPKGDAVAALVFFPRRELEVIAYDNKTPKRIIVLDLPANVPEGITQAAPSMLGVLDPARFFLRWDNNGTSALQIFAAAPGAAAPSWRSLPLGATADFNPALLSPNGRTAAVFARNQILFGNMDGTTPPKPILVASDLNVRLLGMAFSSDSGSIAIYAAVSDLPTIMGYQVRTGEPVFTNLLSQSPLDKAAAIMPHALLWLPGAQVCLINGNDLVDAATGKKFASLGLSGVADAQLLGPSTVALTFKTATGAPYTVLAKMDDEKIRAAKTK